MGCERIGKFLFNWYEGYTIGGQKGVNAWCLYNY